MRLGLFSDLHGNHETLEPTLAALRARKADHLICLGDVLGKSGDNLRCLDLLFAADVKIVRGNHDKHGIRSLPAAYRDKFSERLQNVLRIETFLFAHTTTCVDAIYGRGLWSSDRIHTPEQSAAQFAADPFWIFCYGHTHAAALWDYDGSTTPKLTPIQAPAQYTLDPHRRYLLNPGPLTGRKDIDIESPGRKTAVRGTPSFAFFDSETGMLQVELALAASRIG